MRRLCLLLILLAAAARAAEPLPAPGTSPCATWRSELTSTTTWVILGLGAAGSLAALDDENAGAIRTTLDGSALDGLFDFGNLYGSGWGVAGLGAAFYGWGAAADRPEFRELGVDLVTSFGVTAAAVWAIKAPVNRKRPNGGAHSFPSGHTAAAFSSVPPLWRHAGWQTGTGMAVLATLTGLGRMEEHRHYLSDVIAGAALGLVCGRVTVAACDRGWCLEPTAGGVAVAHRF
ncbi:MAG TPA: phosphatase PAP2 family protein [Candidatus Krumholzibacteria bacterium]|nr:phosphatase PAP2 family protein [Candidatus Krumholzibacteria bacterium]